MAGIPEVKRFFREAGGVDVDTSDLDRYRTFVDEKVDDIAVAGRDSARWNNRDVIAPQDLPITKGLQERMREFGKMESADDMRQWMGQTLRRPPDDVTFGEETEAVLNDVFGGISIALANSFRILEPDLENPTSQTWDRAFALFRMVT
ncbi:MAG TPA: DUF1931 family protein [Blastococcus sp.]|jgi:hypothetical protein